MRIIFIIISALLITGCIHATKIEYIDRIVEVKVPVPIECPAPPKIPKAILPIHSLTKLNRTNPPKVARAYVNSIIILLNENNKLRVVLDAYNHIDK